jgi:flagellar secretion chaperone FliS
MHASPSALNSPFAARGATAMTGMYRQVDVQSAVGGGASPHRLVAMLYDGVVESLAQARGALQAGNVELKARALGRAARIVDEGLRAPLNLNDGGQIARDLHQLYGYITLRLTHANAHNDAAAIEECQRLIAPLREAWAGIGASVAA